MKERIAKSVFWIAWSRGGLQLLSFFTTLLVARLLNPSDYGLMALVSIWTGTIYLLAEMGLGTAIIQFPDLEDSELNSCFWVTMGSAGLGYLALYAAAPAIAAWFRAPLLPDVLRVAGVSLLLVAVRVVPDSLLRKQLSLDKVSQAGVAAAVVTMPVVLTLAWWGVGVWALVAGVLLMPLVQGIVSFWFVRWWPGFRLGSRRLKEVLSYSLATLGGKLSWAIYEQADVFVLGKISGEVTLGFYSMAKQIAMLPVTKVAVVVNQLTFPMMAELQDDRGRMRAVFLRVLRFILCLTAPLCIGGALMAEDLVGFVLSDKWLATAPILQILFLAALGHSICVLIPPLLFARYRAGFMFWWTAGLLVVMPFAFWGGAASMGARGVALAWVVIYPLFIAWLVREAIKELDLRFRFVWDQIWLIMAATLSMVIIVLAVRWSIPGSDAMSRLVRLVAATGAGALTYGFGMYLRGGALVHEILEVVRLIFPRTQSLTAAK